MLFKDLKQGDRFMYRGALIDGENIGISVYVKLEFPVIEFGSSGLDVSPLTAVKEKRRSLMAVQDDTEVLKID